MKFNFFLVFCLFFVQSCANYNNPTLSKSDVIIEKFSNSGFAIIYNDNLYKEKIITKKLNDRDLIIFQRNLKKGTSVKISNPYNKKTVLAKVGKKSNYPTFNNAVLSIRIANDLELDKNEPYIIIEEIMDNASFIAKKAKTYEEEKQVADKAPVDSISVNDLNDNDVKKEEQKDVRKKFNYVIKVADFYFSNTAYEMIKRIKNETEVEKVGVDNINTNTYRVFLGPYKNLNALQNAYNSVENLNFENIEIIKYD